MNLCDNSALELNRLLRGKQVSAVEIAQACLARIRAVDGRPGALDAAELTDEDEREGACLHFAH